MTQVITRNGVPPAKHQAPPPKASTDTSGPQGLKGELGAEWAKADAPPPSEAEHHEHHLHMPHLRHRQHKEK